MSAKIFSKITAIIAIVALILSGVNLYVLYNLLGNVGVLNANVDDLTGMFPEAALVAAARKEGSVSFVTSQVTEDATALASGFETKYGIPLNWIRLTGNEVRQRFEAEQQAGQYTIDVVSTSDMVAFHSWKNSSWLAPYESLYSEYYQDLPVGYAEIPYYYPLRMLLYGAAVNTNVVPGTVQTRNDLIDYAIENQLPVGVYSPDVAVYCWIYGTLVRGGVPRSQWQRLRDADLFSPFVGHGEFIPMLISGEVPLTLSFYDSEVRKAVVNKGAKLRFIPENGTTVLVAADIGISAHAPHPNAAKLFLDYCLSLEGQTIITTVTYQYSARTDVPLFPGQQKWKEINALFEDIEWLNNNFAQIQSEYKQDIGMS